MTTSTPSDVEYAITVLTARTATVTEEEYLRSSIDVLQRDAYRRGAEAQREVDAQIAIAMGKRAQSMRKHGALLGAMLSISESIAEAIRIGKVEETIP